MRSKSEIICHKFIFLNAKLQRHSKKFPPPREQTRSLRTKVGIKVDNEG